MLPRIPHFLLIVLALLAAFAPRSVCAADPGVGGSYEESPALFPAPALRSPPGEVAAFPNLGLAIFDMAWTNFRPRVPLPTVTPTTFTTDFDVLLMAQAGLGEGLAWSWAGVGSATFRVDLSPTSGLGHDLHPVELLHLQIDGAPWLDGGLELHESPTLASTGTMHVNHGPKGDTIEAQLTLYLEAGNASNPKPTPAAGSIQMLGVPEPATAAVLLAAVLVVRRRGRKA